MANLDLDEQGRFVFVCDIGSQFIKYGPAEDFTTIYKFPSVVGRPKVGISVGEKIDDLEIKPLMVCDEALKLSSSLDLSYPNSNGKIQNFDELSAILEKTFSNEKIKTIPEKTKVYVTESSMSTSSDQEKLKEILLKKFKFDSVAFGDQAALTLFGSGLTSGVVVNFYESSIVITPVHFYPIKDKIVQLKIADSGIIAKEIFSLVASVDSKVQVELFKRVLLVGDSTPDASAVENQIKELYLENILKNDEARMSKVKLKVEKLSTDNDRAFTGGATLARMNMNVSEFWSSEKK